MSDEQQVYLKELELVDLRVTGFNLAIGFLGQVPVECRIQRLLQLLLQEVRKRKNFLPM
ncbi:hypothetical protein [Chryseobacterium sp. IHB B 17019]|jgi:hypothetical protein|uniref:hypothetical protein n=1 Tax=Chryseobacterium sp. IHB B 17019 TaxID=1721091 RepID=UPI000A6D875E|nr:hypothetical protein [Chryseobacterium sp. IHB B 17019]